MKKLISILLALAMIATFGLIFVSAEEDEAPVDEAPAVLQSASYGSIKEALDAYLDGIIDVEELIADIVAQIDDGNEDLLEGLDFSVVLPLVTSGKLFELIGALPDLMDELEGFDLSELGAIGSILDVLGNLGGIFNGGFGEIFSNLFGSISTFFGNIFGEGGFFGSIGGFFQEWFGNGLIYFFLYPLDCLLKLIGINVDLLINIKVLDPAA